MGPRSLLVVTPFLKNFIPALSTYNALSAGLVMGIMILPLVTSLSEDAMSAVPASLREGAFALGATRFEVAANMPNEEIGVGDMTVVVDRDGSGAAELLAERENGVGAIEGHMHSLAGGVDGRKRFKPCILHLLPHVYPESGTAVNRAAGMPQPTCWPWLNSGTGRRSAAAGAHRVDDQVELV